MATELKSLGFELAYLALLTSKRVKPLSRWEKEVQAPARDILASLGLRSRLVERRVRSGRSVRELIFSRSEDRLRAYVARFDRTLVDHTAANTRAEGAMFGYPDCCVESFATRGYAPNSLRRADQRILFHWACPGCELTPLLVPLYREVHAECRRSTRWWRLPGVTTGTLPAIAFPFRKAAALVSLAILGALPTVRGQDTVPPDPHLTSPNLWQDQDLDYLRDIEETILGKDPTKADQDGNGTLDGIDFARTVASLIDSLPTEPSNDRAYVTHNLVWGVESCQVCGEQVNMGFMDVINPLENANVGVPYIAKHFLDHGSFNYGGSVHAGRVNPVLVNLLATSMGLGHFIPEPAGSDTDNDGLRDAEEGVFGTDPAKPDTNGDLIIDGIQLARELLARVRALPKAAPGAGPTDRPYVIDHPMDGIETCPRCGDTVVMDIWDVIHPVSGNSISISSMGLHYLEHGAFNWQGGRLMGGQGRVDPVQLAAVLDGQKEPHLLPVSPDRDGDLLTDEEETALGTNPDNPDQEPNGIRDGIDLARSLAGLVGALPQEPSSGSVYRRDFMLRGLEHCDICGENVNMGHLAVCNPLARLYVELPYIALHYMEHGSFSHAGNVHGKDRVDVKLLREAIRSVGPSHLIPGDEDKDCDGLQTAEERHFQTDPALDDTNADGIPDGFRLAREFWRRLGALPRTPGDSCYAVDYLQRGVVTCEVCGQTVNMGYMEVINPAGNRRIEVTYLALHYLEFGSFGSSASSRLSPLALEAVLRPAVTVVVTGGQATVRWAGEPGRRYQLFTATEITGPWEPGLSLTGTGSVLSFTEDSPMQPRKFYKIVTW